MVPLDKRKVAQSNDLIQGVAKMDIVPLKIFELAVSLINPLDPPQNNTVTLSKTELFSFFDVSSDNKYTRFKDAIKTLQENSVIQVRYENDKKGFSFESIVPIPYVKWTDYDDDVIIQFQEKIMPYLINLKENFTQYLITDIGKLNGKYSIILYKWLTMNYNQFKKYGNFDCKNPYLEIKELRKITDTEKEYERFFDFEKWVISESIKDINKNTHYLISYEKIKKGRRIEGIRFNIDEQETKHNLEYISEKAEQYNLRVDDEKDHDSLVYVKAVQDPYIQYIIEKEIIFFNDIKNVTKIFLEVVPLYKKMSNLKPNVYRPMETFENHINYVLEHMVDTSVKFKNITEYLKVAAEDYIFKLEYQERLRNENN